MAEGGRAGQRLTDEMTEEERRELSVGLLRSWWLEATQALVDAVGSEEAMRSLKPHFLHAGRAGRRIYHDITNLELDGLNSANAMGYALAPSIGGSFSPLFRADDGSGMGEMRDCATLGMSKEACYSLCSIMPHGSLQEMNPDWNIQLVRSLSWGDTHCMWRVWREGTDAKVQAKDEMRIPPLHLFHDPLDDATRNYLGLAYAAEYWLMATRAILDCAGGERALDSMYSRMRLSGLSLGLRVAGSRGRGGQLAAWQLIELISDLHQRKGDIRRRGDGWEGTVTECPFAGSAPREICLQYEAFFNGVCEALSPGFEFKYDSMMTGESTSCHWVLRRKGER